MNESWHRHTRVTEIMTVSSWYMWKCLLYIYLARHMSLLHYQSHLAETDGYEWVLPHIWIRKSVVYFDESIHIYIYSIYIWMYINIYLRVNLLCMSLNYRWRCRRRCRCRCRPPCLHIYIHIINGEMIVNMNESWIISPQVKHR